MSVKIIALVEEQQQADNSFIVASVNHTSRKARVQKKRSMAKPYKMPLKKQVDTYGRVPLNSHCAIEVAEDGLYTLDFADTYGITDSWDNLLPWIRDERGCR